MYSVISPVAAHSEKHSFGELNMGFLGFCSVKLLVLVIFLGFVASIEPTRTPERRGLRNVIRVGKRYGEEELWDFPTEDKRFGKLMAFPRVGRSSATWTPDDSPERRSGSKPGIWFGPRIGRSSSQIKSNIDDATKWTYLFLNDADEKPLNRNVHSSDQRPEEEPNDFSEYVSDEFKELIPAY